MNSANAIWFVYALWLILVSYLTISAIGVKQDTEGHLLQSFGILFAIIAAFLLPHLEIFQFVNFAPVSPILSSVGAIITIAGMVFLVWARQTLGRNWSQTVSAKEGHELITSGRIAMFAIRCIPGPDRVHRLRDRRRWCLRLSFRLPNATFSFARQADGATVSGRIP
jgi:hypothetical protein